jgi:hypothetical protein
MYGYLEQVFTLLFLLLLATKLVFEQASLLITRVLFMDSIAPKMAIVRTMDCFDFRMGSTIVN